MKVSIIIVSYNTRTLLKQCLQSVFDKTQDIRFEVIVVDNASQDDSPQMVREEFPEVILIESENKGFGHANNVAAKHAKGKYLFLLNPDTVVQNNAVKILAEFLDNSPQTGICGGNLFDAGKNPATSYQMFLPSLFWELNTFFSGMLGKLRYGRNVSFNHTRHPRKVGYIAGADLMIRHDLFQHLNGFDTDFFVYFEETELTFRAKKAGYEVYSVPQAEIVHLEGKSFSSHKRKSMLYIDSHKLYYKKTHNCLACSVIKMIIIFSCLLRITIYTLLRNKPKRTPWIYILKYIYTARSEV